MHTPCHNNPDFDSSNHRASRRAAAECFACPVFELCDELGRGERWGIWAGTLPESPERVAFRKENDKSVNCRNGHPRALYEVEVDALIVERAPIFGCSKCAALSRQIVEAVA